MIELKKIQGLVFEEYIKNGYVKLWTSKNNSEQPIFDLAELGLADTEISEAKEAIRKSDFQNLGEECADTIIRILNFMSRKGFDAETEIINKNFKNIKRGYLHGKQV